ncbi:uncharacterized protein [Ranitomeya imitator]|uniref:uncharacterized protein n=1 Tax=Ranitomeya imitator TaxID=111125 RepID=UPI0037E8F418
MDLINSYAKSSQIDFVSLYGSSLEIFWSNLFSECRTANLNLDCKLMSKKKEKEQLKNILHMVYVFNEFVIEKSKKDSVERISKETNDVPKIDCNEKSEKDVTHVSVMTMTTQSDIDFVTQDEKQDGGSEGDMTIDKDDLRGTDVPLPLKIDDSEAQLQPKSRKILLKLCKIIPAYDDKIHVCRNSEIFESFADKFDLTNQEKNNLFKIWLPVTFMRRYSLEMQNEEYENMTDVERLRILIFCGLKENYPDLDILLKLKIGQEECTFTFMAIFERIYKLVCTNLNQQSMINCFVNKFKFLNPVSRIIATQKNSLYECAQSLDFSRKHENLERKTHFTKFLKPVRIQSYQKPKSKSSNLIQNQIFEVRRKLHICYKPYEKIQESIKEISLKYLKSEGSDLSVKMAETDRRKQVSIPGGAQLNTPLSQQLFKESIGLKLTLLNTAFQIIDRELHFGIGIG